MVPDPLVAARRYLRIADRLLPDRIVGLYLVGSTALGAYRPDRSDVDVVAVVDRRLDRREVTRLRAVHVAAGVAAVDPALLARGRTKHPGVCNATYVCADDLSRPVSAIAPVAAHVGLEFQVGRGFDVNPVQWATLAHHGIAVRGPEPATLGLDPEPDRLRQWNLDNLAGYWVPWAEARRRRVGLAFRASPRWWTAWGVLGAPRLHHTIATGDVVAKETAGEYALETFDGRWHPIVAEGLAYRRGEPADPRFAHLGTRVGTTAAFVLEVARSARAL